MSEAARVKYITKTVKFGGKELVLYSIDGMTWSTRRNELQAVKERHEAQRVTLNDIKGISPDEDEAEQKEEESDSDEPFELKVEENSPTDDNETSDAQSGASKVLKVAPVPSRNDKKNIKAPQPKLPKRSTSPAKMKLVPSRSKKSAPKASTPKISGKSDKGKKGAAIKIGRSTPKKAAARKSAAKRRAA